MINFSKFFLPFFSQVHLYQSKMLNQLCNLFVLALLLSLVSCDNPIESTTDLAASQDSEEIAQIPEENRELVRKVIKEGRVEFETRDLSATRKQILEVISTHQGYVSSDQEFNYPGRKSNTLVIRIPAGKFDQVLTEATSGVKEFEQKEILVKDMSEEFVDIEARLKTKKELETRYTELLKQAKNVMEMVEIENQIGQLRADIESTEGRLAYLQDQVSFSTLSMTFYESVPEGMGLSHEFKIGFRNGWENLVAFFVLLINIWPFLLLALAGWFGLRVYRGRKG